VLREALGAMSRPIGARDMAQAFKGARKDRVEEILETLVGLGQLVKLEDGRYAR
jgi:hypothetical protein